MTAKRFTSQRTDDYNFSDILDNGKWIGICHVDCEDDFVNKFNELADENKQLKKENEWLKSIHFANDVLKENKELKQSNERLLKMLDNVTNYMQKQNEYMPIDDFAEWWNGIATKGLDGDVE